jgi:hypothetical protein
VIHTYRTELNVAVGPLCAEDLIPDERASDHFREPGSKMMNGKKRRSRIKPAHADHRYDDPCYATFILLATQSPIVSNHPPMNRTTGTCCLFTFDSSLLTSDGIKHLISTPRLKFPTIPCWSISTTSSYATHPRLLPQCTSDDPGQTTPKAPVPSSANTPSDPSYERHEATTSIFRDAIFDVDNVLQSPVSVWRSMDFRATVMDHSLASM